MSHVFFLYINLKKLKIWPIATMLVSFDVLMSLTRICISPIPRLHIFLAVGQFLPPKSLIQFYYLHQSKMYISEEWLFFIKLMCCNAWYNTIIIHLTYHNLCIKVAVKQHLTFTYHNLLLFFPVAFILWQGFI